MTNGTAVAAPAATRRPTRRGTVCKSVLTGGYLTSRIFDLPVPDGAHQLHVLMTDEDAKRTTRSPARQRTA